MSYGERHNVFNDIPGYDASKGERIVKALRRLCAKIEHLEQIRNSERKLLSKEVQTSSNDADWTISDVQYKLLVLQLKYVRSLIKKNWDTSHAVNRGDANAGINIMHEGNGRNQNMANVNNSKDFVNQFVCEGTQTGGSLIEGLDPLTNMEFEKNKDRTDAQVSTDLHGYGFEDSSVQTASTSQKTLPTSSKSHYHLKLDDVPFILGASTTASHSIVANVQNIIAMMKTHNRALCGPRHHVQRAAPPVLNSKETSKRITDLSQELRVLRIQQTRLAKRSEDQGMKQPSSTSEAMATGHKKKANKTGNVNASATNMPRRTRSFSESSKIRAEVANTSKRRRALANVNIQSKTHPTVERRKFLRSLQKFKAHLSEDDISWD